MFNIKRSVAVHLLCRIEYHQPQTPCRCKASSVLPLANVDRTQRMSSATQRWSPSSSTRHCKARHSQIVQCSQTDTDRPFERSAGVGSTVNARSRPVLSSWLPRVRFLGQTLGKLRASTSRTQPGSRNGTTDLARPMTIGSTWRCSNQDRLNQGGQTVGMRATQQQARV